MVLKNNTLHSNENSRLKSVGRFFREAFTIDFNKPLSIKNQFMVMFVTLFISTVLFGVLCFINNTQVAEPPKQPAKPTAVQSQKQTSRQESSQKVILNTELMKKVDIISLPYEEIHNGELILVNKEHQCTHNGESVVSLLNVKTGTYVVADASVSVDQGIVDNVNHMFDDFYDIYGESKVMIACGYRSSELQSELYEAETDREGEDTADIWVAPPGYSEHQTGYAFDLDLMVEDGGIGIDYDGKGNYSWLNENCCQYGFIVRYLEGKENITGYEYEPWHFRYVGVPAATYIMENELTLEEYMDTVQKYSIQKPLMIKGINDEVWYTYYVPAQEKDKTEVPVPQNYSYTISGDNFSGFIVTVTIS